MLSAIPLSSVLVCLFPAVEAVTYKLDKEGYPKNRLLGCSLNAKNYTDCEYEGYAIRAATFAIPPIILGILSFLMTCFFCGGKYCCNCCGGRHPSTGICCPKAAPTYNTCDHIRPKVFLIVWLLITVIGTSIGEVGAAVFHKSISDFRDEATSIGVNIRSELASINKSLTVTRYDPENDAYSQENLFVGTPLDTEGEKIATEVDKQFADGIVETFTLYLGRAKLALFIVFIIPPVLMVIGVIAGLCSIRKFVPMACFFFLGWIMAGPMWILHGCFAVVQFIHSDICAEMKGVSNEQRNIFAALIQCDPALFDTFYDEFRVVLQEKAESVCVTVVDTCYDEANTAAINIQEQRINKCPAVLDTRPECQGQSFGELLAYTRQIYIHPEVEKFKENCKKFPGACTAMPAGFECRQPSSQSQRSIEFASSSDRRQTLEDIQNNLGGSLSDTTPASPSGPRCTIALCATTCTLDDGSLSQFGRSAKAVIVGLKAAVQVGNSLDILGGKFQSCDAALAMFMRKFVDPCFELESGLDRLRVATGIQGCTILGALITLIWGAKRFAKFRPEEGDVFSSPKQNSQGFSPKDGSPSHSGPIYQSPVEGFDR